MTRDKEFIHFFKTPGGNYVFDINTDAILKVQPRVYELLQERQKSSFNEEQDCESWKEENLVIENLKRNGFLSSKRVSEITHPDDEILYYHLNNRLRLVILQVTQYCNLRCEYCAYSGNYNNRTHGNKRMSFEMAQKGIDFLINHSMDSNRISVGFYGGEPLLEFELLKKCIEYAEEKAEGRDISFNVTTNATLLTEEIIEYLAAHNVSTTISIDGPREVHDKNRKFAVSGCGSFDKIMDSIETISSKYPEYLKRLMFNVVMDRENDFSCISNFVTNFEAMKNSIVRTTFISDYYSKNEIKSTEEFGVKRGYELFKFFLHKLGRLDGQHISKVVADYYVQIKQKMDERTMVKSLTDKAHHSGPCIPGAARLFIDAEGNLFPCERVSESSEAVKIGHIDTGFDIERVSNIMNVGRLTQESCKNCWALRHCTLCVAAADNDGDLSGEAKLKFCKGTRDYTEELFSDYCMLKELGHNFEEDGSGTVII